MCIIQCINGYQQIMYIVKQAPGAHIKWFELLRPRQNGGHVADDIFKYFFVNENFRILNKISLKYVPWGLINNAAALLKIMAWGRIGDKPLSEVMLVLFYWRIYASLCLSEFMTQ